jgi:putative ABC transport system permease protein
MSGLIAVLMFELVSFGLYRFVLHLDFQINIWLCLLTPLVSVACVVAAGLWGVKDVANKPPMWVLRDS